MEKPVIEGQIFFKDVDFTDIAGVNSGRRRNVRNKEGVLHIGFDLSYIKKSNGKIVAGWMNEGDFLKFRRNLFRSDSGVGTDAMEY